MIHEAVSEIQLQHRRSEYSSRELERRHGSSGSEDSINQIQNAVHRHGRNGSPGAV